MKNSCFLLRASVWISGVLLAWAVVAQEALDLFPDEPALDNGYVRIAAWNMRHINLESGAEDLLPGTTREEDFALLTGTFAKAIRDMGLDLVAVVEHQPRVGQSNRLLQVRNALNTLGGTWQADETAIPYDGTGGQFGGLQFGLLWNSGRVTVEANADILLHELRQPRDANGALVERTLRVPWLVPVQAGSLSFDLLVLHLKSGGANPQQAEVDAVERYIVQRQSGASPRHLIVCGDWNIRPDQAEGRNRLRQLMAPSSGVNLMRVLTVESMRPTLPEWETLGAIGATSPLAALVPYSHFNEDTVDTFLDHLAISRTLEEIFDHPIEVGLAGGAQDLRPGIRVAMPLLPEESYRRLTDHLPVVLTLRTTGGGVTPPAVPAGLWITGAVPNPVGDDSQNEEVRLRNTGGQPVTLADWRIGDSGGNSYWILNAGDGAVGPGGVAVIRRQGRPMTLNNSGDTIVLIDPTGTAVDQKSYGAVTSGQVVTF